MVPTSEPLRKATATDEYHDTTWEASVGLAASLEMRVVRAGSVSMKAA